MTDGLAIFRDTGWGTRLSTAAEAYLEDYVFSPDEGSDHELNDWERMLMQDFLAGLFSQDDFSALLQEAARGMKAGGMDPEGRDLSRGSGETSNGEQT